MLIHANMHLHPDYSGIMSQIVHNFSSKNFESFKLQFLTKYLALIAFAQTFTRKVLICALCLHY